MATPPTLAQLRENVRHHLQIQTPVDAGISGANVGDQPAGQQDPINTIINAYINKGIDAANRICRAGPVSDYTVSVAAAAATEKRKQYIDISGVISRALQANEVEDVWFIESSTSNSYALEPYAYFQAQTKYKQFPQNPPGRPAQFAIYGTQIMLIPPSDRAGTLTFQAAQGEAPLLSDSAQMQYIPVEYQDFVELYAVLWCLARDGSDVEAQSRMQAFAPMCMQIGMQLYQWKNNYDTSGLNVVRDTMMMIPNAMAMIGGMMQQQAPQPQGQGQ